MIWVNLKVFSGNLCKGSVEVTTESGVIGLDWGPYSYLIKLTVTFTASRKEMRQKEKFTRCYKSL